MLLDTSNLVVLFLFGSLLSYEDEKKNSAQKLKSGRKKWWLTNLSFPNNQKVSSTFNLLHFPFFSFIPFSIKFTNKSLSIYKKEIKDREEAKQRWRGRGDSSGLKIRKERRGRTRKRRKFWNEIRIFRSDN